jgi:hypothetical protein
MYACLPNGLLPSHLPTKILYAPLLFFIHATYPAHLILLYFITRKITGNYWSWSSSWCSLLHSPVTSSLLGPNILVSTIFLKTFSLRSSLNVSDRVSHPHKSTGKIIVLHKSSYTRKKEGCPHGRLFKCNVDIHCRSCQERMAVRSLGDLFSYDGPHLCGRPEWPLMWWPGVRHWATGQRFKMIQKWGEQCLVQTRKDAGLSTRTALALSVLIGYFKTIVLCACFIT